MPKKYSALTPDQKCIYQAFRHAVGNTNSEAEMGDYVNAQGVDADDDKAVHLLAAHYGFDTIAMFRSSDWRSGHYNLEKNTEYILTINGQVGMLHEFERRLNGWLTTLKKTDVESIQRMFPNAVGHALYCKTQKNTHDVETWEDAQNIYKRPPRFGEGGTTLLVTAYGRQRRD